MSCTVAIPSSPVFSPSRRPLSCKAASASPDSASVSSPAPLASTAGSPLRPFSLLRAQIREEASPTSEGAADLVFPPTPPLDTEAPKAASQDDTEALPKASHDAAEAPPKASHDAAEAPPKGSHDTDLTSIDAEAPKAHPDDDLVMVDFKEHPDTHQDADFMDACAFAPPTVEKEEDESNSTFSPQHLKDGFSAPSKGADVVTQPPESDGEPAKQGAGVEDSSACIPTADGGGGGGGGGVTATAKGDRGVSGCSGV